MYVFVFNRGGVEEGLRRGRRVWGVMSVCGMQKSTLVHEQTHPLLITSHITYPLQYTHPTSPPPHTNKQAMQGGGGSVPWTGSVPDLQLAAQQAGLAPWQLQEAAAQLRNQQALLGMQQSASVDNLLAMQNLPQAALLLQAMNNMNAQNALV